MGMERSLGSMQIIRNPRTRMELGVPLPVRPIYIGLDSMAYWLFEAAIASNLANGAEMVHAVKRACRYVEAGIKTSTQFGHGNGPINHFHSTYILPFAPYVRPLFLSSTRWSPLWTVATSLSICWNERMSSKYGVIIPNINLCPKWLLALYQSGPSRDIWFRTIFFW